MNLKPLRVNFTKEVRQKLSSRRKLSALAKINGKGFLYWHRSGYKKKLKCERCKNKKNLIVHHRDRNPGSNDPPYSNLETLCRACHALEHSKEIAIRQRDPEVNKRRGISISKTKQQAKLEGKKYPKVSMASKKTWKGKGGIKLRKSRQSKKYRKLQSLMMKKLMNDPQYLARRKKAREDRLAKTS